MILSEPELTHIERMEELFSRIHHDFDGGVQRHGQTVKPIWKHASQDIGNAQRAAAGHPSQKLARNKGFCEIAGLKRKSQGLLATRKSKKMTLKILALICSLLTANCAFAQPSQEPQELIQLSKDKWAWMADKNVDKLELLFHKNAKFVHMSGTWKKDEELDIIKTGSIWYKNAIVHDAAAEVFGKTAIVWNRITLEAIVRGNEVKTEFTVTEVYQKKGRNWQLLALTFSSVRDTHQIAK